MARTDIHRPGSEDFDPQAYTFHGCFDLTPEWGDGGARMNAINALVEKGYRFAGSAAGTCGHCGAWARYVALLTHDNGRDMMYVGQQCLGNRFSGSKAQFQELRKAAQLDRERQARKAAFLELCEDCPALVWATYAHNIAVAGLGDHRADLPALEQTWGQRYLTSDWSIGVLDDIARKARQYGELSDRQRDLIERLVSELESAEADTAKRDAERAAQAEQAANAQPVPTGLVVIQGEVLTTRWKDNDFGGGSLKMLVQHADGWKVWGTVPSSLEVERGDQVEFTATVEPSDDDPHFGFFKRPRKAQVLAGV